MISETSDLISLRPGGNLIVFLVPHRTSCIVAGSMFPMLPMRAAAPSCHDQNSLLIGKIEKIIRLQLALQPDRIQVHVFNVFKLGSESLRIEAQKHIGGPATAAHQHILTVNFKDTVLLIVQFRCYLPNAETSILAIGNSALRLKIDFHLIQI